ncbi:MAG: 23S rRNA (pseudouridine(1915)-N(3))-methyltransferase RlmH [Bacteroidales bacterium]|nr:23S rRNA (pseudouridine(1915)-N(3))-methyltransferase RlmH [Bacteroidales bacterium]
MKIKIIAIGKTDKEYLKEGIDIYFNRLKHYINSEFVVIPDIKNTRKMDENQQKQKEGELILQSVSNSDILCLLDENGKEFSSVGFSEFINQKMVSGIKTLVFVIGGPYGFSKEVKERANQKLSLSKMTFSHQMVRLLFTEQLYRAFTILKGEPYHHV